MATFTKLGWYSGSGQSALFPVGNTGAITSGDCVVADAGAGQPYIMRAASGNIPIGVAKDSCTAPSADGDVSISVYIDPNDLFVLPCVGATTLTTAFRGKSCDIDVSGSTIGADLDASTDDCVFIIDVDTANSRVLCRIGFNAGFAGVI